MKLKVPYKSQWDSTANASRDDCGPAALCSVLAAFGIDKTVDEVFRATGAPPNSYITFDQVAFASRKFGLNIEHHIISFNELKSKLDQGFPMIALVNYRHFPNKQDKFNGPHFVTVIGRTDNSIFCHDPNRLRGNTYGDGVELNNDQWLKIWEQTNLEHGNKNNQVLIPFRALLGGEEEVDNTENFKQIYQAIYNRPATKEEIDRWNGSGKSAAVCVAELVASLELGEKLEALTTQVSKLETTIGEHHQQTGSRLGSLADSIGQLTSQLEVERKVIADTSSKTDTAAETMTDLIKTDTQQQGLLQGLGERLVTAERAIKDLIAELKKGDTGEEVIEMNKSVLWEAIKEPLRLLVLAIIPAILAYTETISGQWAVILTLVLRGVDKFLHELGKTEGAINTNLIKGLTRF